MKCRHLILVSFTSDLIHSDYCIVPHNISTGKLNVALTPRLFVSYDAGSKQWSFRLYRGEGAYLL